MPIDAKWFAHETLPDQGQRIKFNSKQHGDGVGVVTLIWLGEEICIEIDCDDGRRVGIFQALGDTWSEPVEERP